MTKKIEAVRVGQLVFSILITAFFFSCTESGSLGTGFVDESTVRIDTLSLSALNSQQADPYLGKLTFTPLGKFNDPLFGQTTSIAMFKPSIAKNDTAEISGDDRLVMRLRIGDSNIIGDSGTSPSFNIFPVQDFWRGNTYRKSDSVSVNGWPVDNPSALVGSFEFLQTDTTGIVDVELSAAWKDEFAIFYNSNDDNRDSTYRFENFGLAITPENDGNEIVHVNFSTSNLFIISDSSDTTNLAVSDWTSDIITSSANLSQGQIAISNTLQPYLTINLDDLASQVNNENIVRVEMLVKQDSLALQNSLAINQQRLEFVPLRLQIGPINDIPYQLGFNPTNLISIFSDGVYNFDLTGLFNASLFGDTDISEAYIYAGQNGGILSQTIVFGLDALEESKPQVIVYSLEDE